MNSCETSNPRSCEKQRSNLEQPISKYHFFMLMHTPTNRFWSIDFHMTVVRIFAIILAIALKKNFKMEDRESNYMKFNRKKSIVRGDKLD